MMQELRNQLRCVCSNDMNYAKLIERCVEKLASNLGVVLFQLMERRLFNASQSVFVL